MDEISRPLLARAGEQGVLSQQAIDVALDVSGLRPSRAEWRSAAALAMKLAGVLSLAAGLIFLIAFNWENLGVYARFGMIELPLAAALVIAWIKGVDTFSGKAALFLAVLLLGGLLALFGQTYQTGANVYELFLAWAALAIPWVIACRFAPCWALWLLLLNAAMALYSGFGSSGWIFRLFRDSWQWTPWTPTFLLDLLLYVTLIKLSPWEELGLNAAWLKRGVMVLAMGFGTSAMLYRVFNFDSESHYGALTLEILLFIGASAAIAANAWARKQDLFDFAVLALSWIVITTGLLGRSMAESHAGVGALLVIAIYVIGAAAGAVKFILGVGRQWRIGETAS